ncbi:MAG: HAD hydrolase-like protein [Phycisphaerales bacterium]|jgi:phosphoglycolate phosphatase-like HAD superfamily hydrolase|nr:HAD hydrolase-like protein [Phycisphaerales bacterium]
MLILFDIDATLITTNRAGLYAMLDAGRELVGPRFSIEGIDTAGRLDPVIIHDMLLASGITPTEELHAAFRDAYARHLPRHLTARGGGALPGTTQLVSALARSEDVTLGLLTGNFETTGRHKLRFCGFDDAQFPVAAWGDDSPNRLPHARPERHDLPPVALARAARLREVQPARSLIIGDTPHDVSCAKAHGLRVLGVATGGTSRDELLACGADHAVDDLSRTPDVLDWIRTTLS